MKLKELITANVFINRFANEKKYDKFMSQAVNHGMHKGGDWTEFLGPQAAINPEDNYETWKGAINQLRSQSGGIVVNKLSNHKITPKDQTNVIDSLEKFVNVAFSSRRQEAGLFSKNGQYKLKENYSDYLKKLL